MAITDLTARPAASPLPLLSTESTLHAAQRWEPSSALGRFVVRFSDRLPGPRLLRAHQLSTGLTLLASNLTGAAIVTMLNWLVIPGSGLPDGPTLLPSVIAIVAYLMVAFPLGGWLIFKHSETAWAWLQEGRDPTNDEELAVLRAPLRVTRVLVMLWTVGTLLSSSLAFVDSWQLGIRVLITTLIGGLSTSAFGYLLTERVMRPAARVVLAHRADASAALPGAASRQLLSWALGSGSPIFGVWILGLLTLTGAIEMNSAAGAHRLAVAMLALGSLALVVGLAAELFTARAVAVPVKRLEAAVEDVADGALDARVAIDDATEIGSLQAGFNRMAAGLQEREELRDLFGRHVGDEVADAALERGAQLGGETLHVAAMFVDVIGSTSIATQRPAQEVVDLINRFFEVVVSVAADHGGLVNKFAGDGALVVFGAPTPLDDYATPALRAARQLAAALAIEAPETPATIGVSGGEVIAGNIGTSERFEYTVMGDPVNEAARLCSQAKGLPGRVAVSGALLASADDFERSAWEVSYSVVLRGRSSRTDVACLKHAPPGF